MRGRPAEEIAMRGTAHQHHGLDGEGEGRDMCLRHIGDEPRALAQEAPILVMDEPTASLDFGNQAMVLGRIRDLAAEGYGVVLSTHDPDHALLVATRVAVIAEGGLRAVGAPQDVVTAEMLSSIYRTAVIVEDTPSGRRVCVPAWGRGPQ